MKQSKSDAIEHCDFYLRNVLLNLITTDKAILFFVFCRCLNRLISFRQMFCCRNRFSARCFLSKNRHFAVPVIVLKIFAAVCCILSKIGYIYAVTP